MPYNYIFIGGTATYVHHAGRTTLPEVPPDSSRGRTLLCLDGAGGNPGVLDARVRIGMPLKVEFVDAGEFTVPRFRPA